jgi:cytochrome c553
MTDHASPRRRDPLRLAIAVAVLALAAAAPPAARGQPAGPQPPADIAGIIHVCSSCHGPQGRPISPNFPALAGQQKDYTETQLKGMRDHTREDPHVRTYMTGMAARLTNAQIAEIAAYYAAQPPVPGEPVVSPEVAAGRQIYTQGIAAEGVPPCLACHGDRGQGNGAIPRLAGQSPEYVERELNDFKTLGRTNEIMHQNTLKMTPDQMRAVASYVRTL